ncbi:hypothetical protein LCGC14_0483810 [marine sediment metagenome]|uniref:Uncharacterized protein n=1 Tax=marine sediment metagenome TaxID=412755 RepID=A0A0F9S8G5_9ZZZZ
MGDMADELTEMMLDGKAEHDIGQCQMGCDWCREEESLTCCNKCGWVGLKKEGGATHYGCDYLA